MDDQSINTLCIQIIQAYPEENLFYLGLHFINFDETKIMAT